MKHWADTILPTTKRQPTTNDLPLAKLASKLIHIQHGPVTGSVSKESPLSIFSVASVPTIQITQ